VAGAGVGAVVGHGATHFAKAMGHSGGNVAESLGATGRQLKFQGQQAAGAIKGALTPAGGVSSTQAMTGSMPKVVQAPSHPFPADLGHAKTYPMPAALPVSPQTVAQGRRVPPPLPAQGATGGFPRASANGASPVGQLAGVNMFGG
jgi:hypothetical protein